MLLLHSTCHDLITKFLPNVDVKIKICHQITRQFQKQKNQQITHGLPPGKYSNVTIFTTRWYLRIIQGNTIIKYEYTVYSAEEHNYTQKV